MTPPLQHVQVLIVLIFFLHACGGSSPPETASDASDASDQSWKSAVLLGGDTTQVESNRSSFGFDSPAPNLQPDALALHLTGDEEFNRAFVQAPSTTFAAIDGLGPAFNNDSCIACHARDGRSNYPAGALRDGGEDWFKLEDDAGAFLRISIEGDEVCEPSQANRFCEPVAVPGFSAQLFHRGVAGLRPDSPLSGQADVYVRFETQEIGYADGATVTLRRPVFEVRNPYDNPGEERPEDPHAEPVSRLFQSDVRFSLRMTPPVFGTGLLEAMPQDAILALADPEDVDGDGISGRPNWVHDPVASAQGRADTRALGRFGLKAGAPTVQAQSLGAYRNDMGVTSYLFPQESLTGTDLLENYQRANPGDDGQEATGHEVSEHVANSVVFYTNTLAVPARREADYPDVLRGADLFETTGCAACHTPSFTTGRHRGVWGPGEAIAVPEVENQVIYPYTDMLLHDMGDGLADGRTEFSATGREWRTRPLWGIGLTQSVNPLAGFLHDGRAATIEEAILWHGGEAQTSQERFRALALRDRDAVLAFLDSL